MGCEIMMLQCPLLELIVAVIIIMKIEMMVEVNHYHDDDDTYD